MKASFAPVYDLPLSGLVDYYYIFLGGIELFQGCLPHLVGRDIDVLSLLQWHQH